jgi:hypothetical protein
MKRRYDLMKRQGDVFLIPLELSEQEVASLIPDNQQSKGFYHAGENGDHAHVITHAERYYTLEQSARMYNPIDNGLSMMVLHLTEPDVLRHKALKADADAPHADIPLAPGWYEPRIQRIWSPTRSRRNAD